MTTSPMDLSPKLFKVFSFDVFDTLLARPYLRPVDLFRSVAKKLAYLYPNFAVDPQDFMRARIAAEHAARALAKDEGKDDITLKEIYQSFSELDRWGIPRDTALQEEINCELDAVHPIRENVERANALITSGRRVIFVSDMYLPPACILKMLHAAGVCASAEALYVSGTIGHTKRSGRLFDHVLEKEGVSSRDVIHIGDNRASDFTKARTRGIQARHFDFGTTRYEVEHPSKTIRSSAAGLSRACRLACASGNSAASRLASNVIAPFLVGFVAYVLDDAKRSGLKKLYFLSRDGQILLKIAEALRRDTDDHLQCRYLYGSRQAWFLPSVTEPKIEQIKWSYTHGRPSTLQQILDRLELTFPEVRDSLASAGFQSDGLDAVLSRDEAIAVACAITSGNAAGILLERAKDRRKQLLRYLSQEEFTTDMEKSAIVDVGWTLKTQSALSRILLAEGYTPRLKGYYMGVYSGHEPLNDVGDAVAYVTQSESDLPSPLKGDWYFRLPSLMLVEDLFTLADHPGVMGYLKHGRKPVPTFKVDSRTDKLKQFVEDLHTEIIGYAKSVANHSQIDPLSSEFRERAFSNVQKFVTDPERDDVRDIAWIPSSWDRSQNAQQNARLAHPLGFRDLAQMVSTDLLSSRSFISSQYAWPAGAAAISPWPVQKMFRTLRQIAPLAWGAKRVLNGLS